MSIFLTILTILSTTTASVDYVTSVHPHAHVVFNEFFEVPNNDFSLRYKDERYIRLASKYFYRFNCSDFKDCLIPDNSSISIYINIQRNIYFNGTILNQAIATLGEVNSQWFLYNEIMKSENRSIVHNDDLYTIEDYTVVKNYPYIPYGATHLQKQNVHVTRSKRYHERITLDPNPTKSFYTDYSRDSVDHLYVRCLNENFKSIDEMHSYTCFNKKLTFDWYRKLKDQFRYSAYFDINSIMHLASIQRILSCQSSFSYGGITIRKVGKKYIFMHRERNITETFRLNVTRVENITASMSSVDTRVSIAIHMIEHELTTFYRGQYRYRLENNRFIQEPFEMSATDYANYYGPSTDWYLQKKAEYANLSEINFKPDFDPLVQTEIQLRNLQLKDIPDAEAMPWISKYVKSGKTYQYGVTEYSFNKQLQSRNVLERTLKSIRHSEKLTVQQTTAVRITTKKHGYYLVQDGNTYYAYIWLKDQEISKTLLRKYFNPTQPGLYLAKKEMQLRKGKTDPDFELTETGLKHTNYIRSKMDMLVNGYSIWNEKDYRSIEFLMDGGTVVLGTSIWAYGTKGTLYKIEPETYLYVRKTKYCKGEKCPFVQLKSKIAIKNNYEFEYENSTRFFSICWCLSTALLAMFCACAKDLFVLPAGCFKKRTLPEPIPDGKGNEKENGNENEKENENGNGNGNGNEKEKGKGKPNKKPFPYTIPPKLQRPLAKSGVAPFPSEVPSPLLDGDTELEFPGESPKLTSESKKQSRKRRRKRRNTQKSPNSITAPPSKSTSKSIGSNRNESLLGDLSLEDPNKTKSTVNDPMFKDQKPNELTHVFPSGMAISFIPAVDIEKEQRYRYLVRSSSNGKIGPCFPPNEEEDDDEYGCWEAIMNCCQWNKTTDGVITLAQRPKQQTDLKINQNPGSDDESGSDESGTDDQNPGTDDKSGPDVQNPGSDDQNPGPDVQKNTFTNNEQPVGTDPADNIVLNDDSKSGSDHALTDNQEPDSGHAPTDQNGFKLTQREPVVDQILTATNFSKKAPNATGPIFEFLNSGGSSGFKDQEKSITSGYVAGGFSRKDVIDFGTGINSQTVSTPPSNVSYFNFPNLANSHRKTDSSSDISDSGDLAEVMGKLSKKRSKPTNLLSSELAKDQNNKRKLAKQKLTKTKNPASGLGSMAMFSGAKGSRFAFNVSSEDRENQANDLEKQLQNESNEVDKKTSFSFGWPFNFELPGFKNNNQTNANAFDDGKADENEQKDTNEKERTNEQKDERTNDANERTNEKDEHANKQNEHTNDANERTNEKDEHTNDANERTNEKDEHTNDANEHTNEKDEHTNDNANDQPNANARKENENNPPVHAPKQNSKLLTKPNKGKGKKNKNKNRGNNSAQTNKNKGKPSAKKYKKRTKSTKTKGKGNHQSKAKSGNKKQSCKPANHKKNKNDKGSGGGGSTSLFKAIRNHASRIGNKYSKSTKKETNGTKSNGTKSNSNGTIICDDLNEIAYGISLTNPDIQPSVFESIQESQISDADIAFLNQSQESESVYIESAKPDVTKVIVNNETITAANDIPVPVDMDLVESQTVDLDSDKVTDSLGSNADKATNSLDNLDSSDDVLNAFGDDSNAIDPLNAITVDDDLNDESDDGFDPIDASNAKLSSNTIGDSDDGFDPITASNAKLRSNTIGDESDDSFGPIDDSNDGFGSIDADLSLEPIDPVVKSVSIDLNAINSIDDSVSIDLKTERTLTETIFKSNENSSRVTNKPLFEMHQRDIYNETVNRRNKLLTLLPNSFRSKKTIEETTSIFAKEPPQQPKMEFITKQLSSISEKGKSISSSIKETEFYASVSSFFGQSKKKKQVPIFQDEIIQPKPYKFPKRNSTPEPVFRNVATNFDESSVPISESLSSKDPLDSPSPVITSYTSRIKEADEKIADLSKQIFKLSNKRPTQEERDAEETMTREEIEKSRAEKIRITSLQLNHLHKIRRETNCARDSYVRLEDAEIQMNMLKELIKMKNSGKLIGEDLHETAEHVVVDSDDSFVVAPQQTFSGLNLAYRFAQRDDYLSPDGYFINNETGQRSVNQTEKSNAEKIALRMPIADHLAKFPDVAHWPDSNEQKLLSEDEPHPYQEAIFRHETKRKKLLQAKRRKRRKEKAQAINDGTYDPRDFCDVDDHSDNENINITWGFQNTFTTKQLLANTHCDKYFTDKKHTLMGLSRKYVDYIRRDQHRCRINGRIYYACKKYGIVFGFTRGVYSYKFPISMEQAIEQNYAELAGYKTIEVNDSDYEFEDEDEDEDEYSQSGSDIVLYSDTDSAAHSVDAI